MHKPLLLIIFLLFAFSDLHSQWQHVEEPIQPFLYIKDIEKKGNLLLASNNCGVFTLTPGATEWKRITHHYTPKMYRVGDSVFTSFYHGIGIIDLTNTPLKEYHVPSSDTLYNAPSFAFRDSLMFITSYYGMYISEDHGDSLQPYTSGLPMDTVNRRSVPEYILPTRDVITTPDFAFCATQKGVYRSNFTLNGWEQKNNGLENAAIEKLLFERDTLYAMSRDSIYISIDTGNSWFSIYGNSPRLTDMAVYNGEILVSGYSKGLFRSSDGGLNWLPDSAFTGKEVNMITVSGNVLFTSVMNEGIYYWDGLKWNYILTDKLYCTYTSGLKNSADHVLIVSHGKVLRLEAGDVWTDVTPVDSTAGAYHEIESKGDTVFVAPESTYIRPIIYYTTDNGDNWNKLNTDSLPFQFYHEIKLKFLEGKLYLITDKSLFSTADLGQSWQNLNPALSSYWIGDLALQNGDIYLTTNRSNALLLKKAGSTTWEWKTGLFDPNAYMSYFTLADSALFVNAGAKTYRKFANSNNWTLTDSKVWYMTGSIYHNKLLFVSSYDDVNYSPDLGDNWYSLGVIGANWIHDLGIIHDTLYAATHNAGVWKNAIPNFFAIDERSSVPRIIYLYPNPTSDAVTFSSTEIPEGRFYIIDLSGRICYSTNFRSGEAVNIPVLAEGLYQVTIETSKGKFNQPLMIKH